MSVAWDLYLNAPISPERFADCRNRCWEAFADQRANIQRVFEATTPRTVVCLGAGALNDIPYREFIRAGASLHLVDWLPGAVMNGIDLSIVESTERGEPCCLYSDSRVSGIDYCQHFQRGCDLKTQVCERYATRPDMSPRCTAFAKGIYPIIHQEDVTGGYATEFGRQVLAELRGVRRWKQALAKGLALARRAGGRHAPLGIPSHSADLVTSSMLLSQFEHEPYAYFAHRVADQIGPPSQREEDELHSLGEELRGVLLDQQVERHCLEIKRLLAPGGRCYLSFELFHRLETARWFVVTGMSRALEIVGRHFLLNFDILPERNVMGRFQTDATPSLVCGLLLEAK